MLRITVFSTKILSHLKPTEQFLVLYVSEEKKDYGKEQRAKISDFISLGTETTFILIKLTFQQISKLL